jgi:MoxR-like ATPase
VEHVVEMAAPVLVHRLVLNFRAETEKVQAVDLVQEMVKVAGK